MSRTRLCLLAAFAGTLAPVNAPADEVGHYRVGLGRADITPAYPIRLNGFGSRRAESEGMTQRIWAKAIAIDDGSDQPALIITADILGIPISVRDELARRFLKKTGLKPERLALTATHTHSAPMLSGANTTLFGVPIPPEHLAHIDRYTVEFLDRLERAGLDALRDLRPARLSWGIGSVGFARNRRQIGGPVDHDLPVLVVRDPSGAVRAVYTSYACHCVTLSDNRVSGDWAGFAQEAIEDAFPGAMALVSIGCGADANPSSGVTGSRVEAAIQQGREVAAEVRRLVGGYLRPVTGKLTARTRSLELAFADPPSRDEWTERAKRTGAVGHHARVQLAKLDRGERLRTKIDYPVQTWAFGDSLAIAFLPGEVVVDYSLRLKRELDGLRLWINAYANDAPGYIPSERVLREGGYEGGGAMVYYDQPGPFRPGLEEPIVRTVRELLGAVYAVPFDPAGTQGTRPLSPQRSRAAWQARPGLAVDLVAAEPLLDSPVAIDFGPDGRLWVAEMVDYPSGVRGRFEPGGRVRVLEDTDGDGFYDKATVFLDNIPFPTGVTVWRKGVLVCAAPDILYAEDTDGDGKADVVRKLYSGFGTDNYQARVNSLRYGLDGWVYGSCGLFGGTIRSFNGTELRLGDRDFRIRPDTGAIEPAAGRTQQGRVRDDWDNWFGCDNSTLVRHYALADHYLRRNPHAAAPDGSVYVPDYPASNRLYPAKADAQRFKNSGPPGLVTAACGLGIYRDDLLGPDLAGNTFTCEPVNIVVHRLGLTPRGSTFSGRRTAGERESEFLASTDNWSRPVQAVAGPDGALWVVDMYRFVIEHPRWIPAEDLKRLDVRAGHGLGRIYRVRPAERPVRPTPRLDRLDPAGLVAALDSSSGWQRDLATQMLLWRGNRSAAGDLEKLAGAARRPETRVHALCTLDGLGALTPARVRAALADAHPGVRRHAVRIAERFLADAPYLGPALLAAAADPDPQVRLQAAYSLGVWNDPRSASALSRLALRPDGDPFVRAAVLSSVNGGNLVEVLKVVRTQAPGKLPPAAFVQQLLSTAAGLDGGKHLRAALAAVTEARGGQFAPWQMAAVAGVLDSLERQGKSLTTMSAQERQIVDPLLAGAARTANDPAAAESDRLAALPLLGRHPARRADDLSALGNLLTPETPPTLAGAAVTALARTGDERVPALLIAGWKSYSPALKGQVLDTLLGRPAWASPTLDALAKRDLPPAEVDAARRRRLLAHPDPAIRTRAEGVFAGAVNPDRRKVLEDYGSVGEMTGDRARGKAVFGKSCATCHLLEGVGSAVGPDLAALANRTPQFLLGEILDPNRNVDSRYVEYQATTTSGRVVNGLLAGETATTVILRGSQGREETILRGDLESFGGTGKSLMPEGLEKEIPKQQMADLLAYLTGKAAPPKRVAGNTPAVTRPVDGRLTLRASAAGIHGSAITFEPELGNIGMWHGVNDYVIWEVVLDGAGEFDVYLDYACADESAGNAFVLEGGEPVLRGKVSGTSGWARYRQVKLGSVRLGAGAGRLVFRPDGNLNGALLDLRTLYLVPKGAAFTPERKEPSR